MTTDDAAKASEVLGNNCGVDAALQTPSFVRKSFESTGVPPYSVKQKTPPTKMTTELFVFFSFIIALLPKSKFYLF